MILSGNEKREKNRELHGSKARYALSFNPADFSKFTPRALRRSLLGFLLGYEEKYQETLMHKLLAGGSTVKRQDRIIDALGGRWGPIGGVKSVQVLLVDFGGDPERHAQAWFEGSPEWY
jgi:hypothetical protein